MKLLIQALVSHLILIAVSLTPALVDAAIYYVATSGNDGVSCATAQNLGTPKRTISNAINCLRAGDTLYIRAGTYNENIWNTTIAGTETQPIIIAGYPGDARPVIRGPANLGDVPVFMLGWRASRLPYHVTLRDFDIDGIDNTDPNSCLSLGGPNITVDNLIIRNCGRDGIQAFSKFLTIRNSRILNCGRIQPSKDFNAKGLGIYISPDDTTDMANAIGGNVLFENNVIDGCRAGGVVIHYQKADNNIIRNNIIRNYGLDSPWPIPSNTPDGFENYGTGVTIGGASTYGHPGPQNNLVFNNVIYNGRGRDSSGNPYGQCFLFWGTGWGNTIYSNTCHNTDIGTIYLCNSKNDAIIRNNIFSSISRETYVCGSNTGAYANNLHNPNPSSTFLNESAADFRLRWDSPAVNAGGTLGIPYNIDKDGVSRPQSSGYDIGAYEYSVQSVGRPSAPINVRVESH